MSTESLLLVIAAAIAHATWNLIAKRAASVGPVFVFAYSVCGVLIFAPWVVWILLQDQGRWDAAAIGCIALSGAVHLAYGLCLQRGYQVADLSVVYPVARGTGPMLSTIGAFVFLREPASLSGIAGMLCVVSGVMMIATQGRLARLLQRESMVGVRWGVVTGALIACYTLIDAYGVKTLLIAPVVFDWAATGARAAFLLPHLARTPQKSIQAMQGKWHLAWIVGLLSPLGYILVLMALQNGSPVSLVAPAREMSMLLATIAGLYLLREPVGWGRMLGCILIAAGVALLAGS